MNYDEAMSGAEKAGTLRRNNRRQVYRMTTWSIGGVAILAALIWLPEGPLQTYARQSSGQQQAKSAVTQQQKGVVALTAPAHGDSPHISAPDAGYAPSVTGYGFTVHCVYSDGSDRVIGDSTNPCVAGPIVYWYVHDTSGKANTVTYKFARPS